MWQHFQVVGTGLHLPRRRLSAEDIDRRAGVPAGWTRTQIGILNRHECAAPETLASLACEAAAAALTDAAVGWQEIDLIIDGSTCRHQPIPFNAACLQAEFGPAAQGIACMDVHSTCLGFVLALHVANSLLASAAYRHILIVCSEAGLAGVNWKEPESACLLGDGAAAVVLHRTPPRLTWFFAHETYSQYVETCQVRGGGHNLPPFACTPENEAAFRFHMDGPLLFRAAGKHLPRMTQTLLASAGLAAGTLHVIPHQASPKALVIFRRLMGFRTEFVHDRIAQLGNMAAASIPAVLHQCRTEGIIPAGANVMLLGTSAGYSQAVAIFQV
jgi:3-oxoacyl-[acyl-carrier-protein] synthase-3